MLLNQNKIQQHKNDIEKRIQELEKKLKEPIKTSQVFQQTHKDTYARRSQVQRYQPEPAYEGRTRQQYVEPPEVEQIRRRNILREKTPIQIEIQNRRPNYERYGEQSKYEGYREKGEGKIMNNSFQAHNYRQISGSRNIEAPVSTTNNRDLYDMMTMIIQNQKNLQEEIVLMRSEWGQKQRPQSHNTTKIHESYQTPFHGIGQSALRVSNVDADESKTYEIRNFYPQNKTIGKSTQGKSKKRVEIETVPKQYSFENSDKHQPHLKPILVEPQPQIKQNRAVSRQKTQQPKKNTSIDLHNLIKNQKTRGERLVVTEDDRKEFWKKVDGRIRESQKQYRDTFHRNNRHQHQHLIATSELQKKLKNDLLEKIYSQCNKCMYK